MTSGIHHITAISSDAKKCVAFYTQTLGLRLVKKSVNQDDVRTYHLFFGDRLGHPGMDLTFFIFLPPMTGASGNGLVTRISLAVPSGSLPFWTKRFAALGVPQEKIAERFGKKRLAFTDPDGLGLELVETDDEGSANDVWETNDIGKKHAIRSFYGATLSVPDRELIEPVLTGVFGYTETGISGKTHELTAGKNGRAAKLEIAEDPELPWGQMGAGTVHHIAFRAKNAHDQLALREKVLAAHLMPTEVIDRFYFQSVYFRTHGRILCEIATDGPGFTADEKEPELGKKLALPPFLVPYRKEIEGQLIPIE